MKGVPFVNRRDIKGVPFLSKIVNKRIKGLDLWAEPPHGDKLERDNLLYLLLTFPWICE